jgi:hypothetical protein
MFLIQVVSHFIFLVYKLKCCCSFFEVFYVLCLLQNNISKYMNSLGSWKVSASILLKALFMMWFCAVVDYTFMYICAQWWNCWLQWEGIWLVVCGWCQENFDVLIRSRVAGLCHWGVPVLSICACLFVFLLCYFNVFNTVFL